MGNEIIGTVRTKTLVSYVSNTYNVIDITEFNGHKFYVTDVIYKTYDDGYLEPLIITDIHYLVRGKDTSR